MTSVCERLEATLPTAGITWDSLKSFTWTILILFFFRNCNAVSFEYWFMFNKQILRKIGYSRMLGN